MTSIPSAAEFLPTDLSFKEVEEHFSNAVLLGNMEKIKDILKLHRSINVDKPIYDHGPTPLFLAVTLQRLDLLDLLLKYGADPSIPCATVVNSQRWNRVLDSTCTKLVYPLQKAADLENSHMIRRLMQAGVYLNQYNKGLPGLVVIAAKCGDMSLMECLYSQLEVESSLWNVDWAEALMTGVRTGDHFMVSYLIRIGADPNKEHEGILPLTAAAYNEDLHMCQLLIQHGAALDGCKTISLGTYKSPLSCAVLGGLKPAIPLLIECGCNLNASLDWSISMQDESRVLSAGASMLHIAVFKRNISIITMLVEKGAHLNAADSEKNTALHVACSDPLGLEVVRCLLKYRKPGDQMERIKLQNGLASLNLNPKRIASVKKNAKDRCTKQCNGRVSIDKYLDVNPLGKYSTTPLFRAVSAQLADTVRELLASGADLNIRNKNGQMVLHEAVLQRSDVLTQVLLDAGAPVDIRDRNGYTPLALAIRNGDVLLTELLLEFGADPMLKSHSGENLLHLAVQAQSNELLTLLISQGFDVNAPMPSGETGLILAAKVPNDEVIQTLTMKGAQLNVCDGNQQSALFYSIYYGHENNARWLIREGAALNLSQNRDGSSLYWSIINCRKLSFMFLLQVGVKFTLKEFSQDYPASLDIKQDPDLVEYVEDIFSQPRMLLDCCRLSARKALIESAAGRGISQSLDKLPIPKQLQDYLFYEEPPKTDNTAQFEYLE